MSLQRADRKVKGRSGHLAAWEMQQDGADFSKCVAEEIAAIKHAFEHKHDLESLILLRELARRWIDLNLTVEEGINQLATLCVTEIVGAAPTVAGRKGSSSTPGPN